jgi:hypothetical protein
MPAVPRPVLLLTILAPLLLSLGCTTTVSGSASPAGSTQGTTTTVDSVQWVDGVCGDLLPFVRAAGTPPQLTSAADPTALVKSISDYLAQGAGAADSAITGMARVGPSPVSGGDQVVTRLTETLTKFRTSFQNAKTQVDAVDTTDQQALITELPKAVAPLQDLANMPDPTVDLQTNPELQRASTQAPNCQQIQRQVGG